MSDHSTFSGSAADVGAHPDLDAEQAHLDQAHRCLGAMRARSQHIHDGEFPGVVYADGLVAHEDEWNRTAKRRLADLETAGSALCFGRIDRDGERWYIGRRHVEDEDGDTVVADWRAGVSTPFYRATYADPMGVELRRRLIVDDRRVVDLFDEHLDDPEGQGTGSYVPDPLLAELGRRRTGEMRDIVATIQAEQDVVIRSSLPGCLVVQGGPGTGKTAVGLHRAAYLLYEHRDLIREEGGLLIVGPNRVFLHYVQQVLPSLGEESATQLTVDALASRGYYARASEPDEVATLKGDPRMAEVVRRALTLDVGPASATVEISTQFTTVAFERSDIEPLIESARRSGRPMSRSRDVLRHQLIDLAWKAYLSRPHADVAHQAAFEAELRGRKEFKACLDRIWPTPSPGAAVRKLLSSRRTLARAADGILTTEEQQLLLRTAGPRLSREPWTRADLVLIDEARDMLEGPAARFGHVVVDEAQDLSAMELRMIARTAAAGSMTILGDVAQATAPAALHDWRLALDALGQPDARIEELEVGYRVPAPILEFANRLLPAIDPGLRPARSVREIGDPPAVRAAETDTLPTAVIETAASRLRIWHTVAIISPDHLIDPLVDLATAAGIAPVDARRGQGLGERLTVLSSTLAKGLEFDAVIVVEPAQIVAEHRNGIQSLYIDLTRAVQSLDIVHAEPLPEALFHASDGPMAPDHEGAGCICSSSPLAESG